MTVFQLVCAAQINMNSPDIPLTTLYIVFGAYIAIEWAYFIFFGGFLHRNRPYTHHKRVSRQSVCSACGGDYGYCGIYSYALGAQRYRKSRKAAYAGGDSFRYRTCCHKAFGAQYKRCIQLDKNRRRFNTAVGNSEDRFRLCRCGYARIPAINEKPYKISCVCAFLYRLSVPYEGFRYGTYILLYILNNGIPALGRYKDHISCMRGSSRRRRSCAYV